MHNISFTNYFIVDDSFFEVLFSDNSEEVKKAIEILDYIYYKGCFTFSSPLVEKKIRKELVSIIKSIIQKIEKTFFLNKKRVVLRG